MVSPMFEASVKEFPFVTELPKRKVSRLQAFWERFQEMRALQERKGILISPFIAAELLGISHQRVHELMEDGRLERVEWRGRVFVTENDLIAYAHAERKAGRPCGPATNMQALKVAVKGGLAARKQYAESRLGKTEKK